MRRRYREGKCGKGKQERRTGRDGEEKMKGM
ncbi:hypothetical protein E2C01_085319 [Portunus trituberculatus]|uniref:Uncharacterized protein n=1 Tax=Portunus trituberculatus TaxID=210409 RepID=A0A5B7J6F7_PORTR|nr:hypothetical protein [Portunus trituberculatus]